VSEKQPLYIHAHNEGKPLDELLFWQEFHQLRLLLVVLANEPISSLPMVMLHPDNGEVFQFVNMPRTMDAWLADDSEVSTDLRERAEDLRKSFKS
jgi:hypothetical protein